MQVLLLERVENLGNLGDKVNVKSGYGRNFLLPQGKATIATPDNIAVFEARRAELEAKQAGELSVAQSRADKLKDMAISIPAKVGVEGKLFGSLGTIDIAEAVTAAGVEILRAEVRLPDGPLRTVGEHIVEIHLHTDLDASVTVTVINDGEALDIDAVEAAAEEDAEEDAE